jgi:predicted TIM-barrel fold metal-dependent hydrolase
VGAGIVGWADLRNPSIAARTLDAHIEAGRGRFSGVRHNVLWHKHESLVGPRKFPRHLLLDTTFRAGLREVARRRLTYDVWMFHEQLPELAATAAAFPDLTIILDHLGGPVTHVATPKARKEVFDQWRSHLPELARRPNIYLKIGGLGMHQFGFEKQAPRPRSSELAPLWQPYVDAAINAFGPERCMFESNFPVDKHSFAYDTLWNTFKTLTINYSTRERGALFRGTASRVYKLNLG